MRRETRNRVMDLHAQARDANSESEVMDVIERLHGLLMTRASTQATARRDETMGQSTYVVDAKMGSGTWSHSIAQSVAHLYFCECARVNTSGTSTRYLINGHEPYRLNAVVMIGAMIEAVNNAARQSSREDRPRDSDPWAYITSLRNAAAYRVAQKCNRLTEAARVGGFQARETGEVVPPMAETYDQEWSAASEYMRSITRRNSYVQVVFDVMHEAGLKSNDTTTIDLVLDALPWARDSQERPKISAAMFSLVSLGILAKTHTKRGQKRVYKVVEDLTPALRPAQSGEPLGVKYNARRPLGRGVRAGGSDPQKSTGPDIEIIGARARVLHDIDSALAQVDAAKAMVSESMGDVQVAQAILSEALENLNQAMTAHR